MTTQTLHWQDITTDPLVVRVKTAAADAASQVKVSEKRRNSLAGAANLILQLANLLVFVNYEIPLWATIIIALVIGAAEIVVHAFSKTPVTQGVVEQVTAAAEQQVIRERLAAVPAPTPAQPAQESAAVPHLPSGLPVYDGDTTGGLPHFDRE